MTTDEFILLIEESVARSSKHDKGFFTLHIGPRDAEVPRINRYFAVISDIHNERYIVMSKYRVQDPILSSQVATDPVCTSAYNSDCTKDFVTSTISRVASHLVWKYDDLEYIRELDTELRSLSITQAAYRDFLDVLITASQQGPTDIIFNNSTYIGDYRFHVVDVDSGQTIGVLLDEESIEGSEDAHNLHQLFTLDADDCVGKTWSTIVEANEWELLDFDGQMGSYDGNDLHAELIARATASGLPSAHWLTVILRQKGVERVVLFMSKRLRIGNRQLYLTTYSYNRIPPAKCAEGCPRNSECAPDGTFCTCSDNFMTIGDKFECESVFYIEQPSDFVVQFAIILMLCGVLITICTSLMMFYFRNTKLVKMSSHLSCQCVLGGIGIMFQACLTFVFSPSHFNLICILRPVLMMFSSNLVLISLFSKTWRIQVLINNIQLKKMFITDKKLFIMILKMLSPLVTMLLVWIILFTPEYVIEYDDNVSATGNRAIGVCSTEAPMALFFGVVMTACLIWGFIQAFKSRYAPLGANESKEIMLTLFFFLTFGLLIIPMQFMVSDVNTLAWIRGVGCLSGSFVILFSVFGKKVRWLASGYGNDDAMVQISASKSSSLKKYGHGSSSLDSGSRNRNYSVGLSPTVTITTVSQANRRSRTLKKQNVTQTLADRDKAAAEQAAFQRRLPPCDITDPNYGPSQFQPHSKIQPQEIASITKESNAASILRSHKTRKSVIYQTISQENTILSDDSSAYVTPINSDYADDPMNLANGSMLQMYSYDSWNDGNNSTNNSILINPSRRHAKKKPTGDRSNLNTFGGYDKHKNIVTTDSNFDSTFGSENSSIIYFARPRAMNGVTQ
eukprot:TRINITY_DN5835_c1_g1_i1.p1 TRINITY_DN5835_c1_g1~~TRINITY_DN5835_c1_g1_i1.p1  ORF type:complete len:848 (+),score=168.73 TRINITY_DN5835_c1_g1_i1:153-2696(+)